MPETSSFSCCKLKSDEEGADKRKWWTRVTITVGSILIILTVIIVIVWHRLDTKSTAKTKNNKNITFMSKIAEFKNNKIDISRANVVADNRLCMDIGMDVLHDGGNAIDATVAMLFCQGVVEPQHSGLGGGFVMNIYLRDTKKMVVLDATVEAPEKAVPTMLNFDANENLGRHGWLRVCVPGELMGLWEAHKKYGTLEWSRLVNPSIRLADYGYTVSHDLSKHLVLHRKVLVKDSNLKDIFINPETNSYYREGEIMVNKPLAEALKQISVRGINHIYTKNDKIANESFHNGGILTRNDFDNYKIKWKRSIRQNFFSNERIYSIHMPPPPNYAIIVGMIINIMSEYSSKSEFIDHYYYPYGIIAYYHKIVEAMKHSFAKSCLFGDSSNITEEELNNFLDPHFGTVTRVLINDLNTFDLNYYLRSFDLPSTKVASGGGTCVGVVDPQGNTVGVCSSLNDPFGAGVFSKTLGFILNNYLLNFDTAIPFNVTDYSKYLNIINPGKRPVTTMCPLIILNPDDNFELLILAAGDRRAVTSVALVLIRYIWMKTGMLQAIQKIRFHHQLIPNYVTYEGGESNILMKELISYGHKIKHSSSSWPSISSILSINNSLYIFVDIKERPENNQHDF